MALDISTVSRYALWLDKNIGNSQKDYVDFYYKTGLFRGNEYIWRKK